MASMKYRDPVTQQWVAITAAGPTGPAGLQGVPGPVGPPGPQPPLSSSPPAPLAPIANPGYSTIASKSDHVHPTSGLVTATTQFGGDVTGTYNAIVIKDNSHVHNNYVPVVGGVMTGNLAIQASQGGSILTLNAIDTTGEFEAGVILRRRGIDRWHIGKDRTGESGGDQGSNLAIYRTNDAGSASNLAVWVSRATGEVEFSGPVSLLTVPTTAYHAVRKDYVDNRTPPIIVLSSSAAVPPGTVAGTVIIRTI